MKPRLAAPPGHPDADAINLALAHLPESLANEYRGKLKSNDAGTLVELAFIGRLLQKADGDIRIVPWPKGSRIDADLIGLSNPIELEVKAEIATKYDRDVVAMCENARKRIEAEFPELTEHVRLKNLLVERTTDDGKIELDEEGTIAHVMEGVRRAVIDGKAIAPEYRKFDPGRLVARIDHDAHTWVSLSYATLSGNLDLDVHARTLKRALDDKHQFTGDRSAVLTLINVRDPRANRLDLLLDPYFEKYTHLAAVAAVPYPSINGTPNVYTPELEIAATKPLAIGAEDAYRLAEFFRVRIGMDDYLGELEQSHRERAREIEGAEKSD